jgi:hypothetical protein
MLTSSNVSANLAVTTFKVNNLGKRFGSSGVCVRARVRGGGAYRPLHRDPQWSIGSYWPLHRDPQWSIVLPLSLIIPSAILHFGCSAGFYTCGRRSSHLVPWDVDPDGEILDKLGPHIHTGYVWLFRFLPDTCHKWDCYLVSVWRGVHSGDSVLQVVLSPIAAGFYSASTVLLAEGPFMNLFACLSPVKDHQYFLWFTIVQSLIAFLATPMEMPQAGSGPISSHLFIMSEVYHDWMKRSRVFSDCWKKVGKWWVWRGRDEDSL